MGFCFIFKGLLNISYRQICFTLFTSAFFLGVIPSVQAMDQSDEESSSASYHCPPPEITANDRKNFKIIQSVKNFVPLTNAHLDEISSLLNDPVKVELSFKKYLYLKSPNEFHGANSTVFIGLLENGIKVLTKKSIIHTPEGPIETHYALEQAMCELFAPQIARAYFDVPTLPPTAFISLPDDQFEVRQFLIDGALPEEIEDEQLNYLFNKLLKQPELFNRSPSFLWQLDLFDNFIAADDRNGTQFLWIPCKNRENNYQKAAFMAIDYAETFYDFFDKEEVDKGNSMSCLSTLDHRGTFSGLKKLEYLCKIYPTFFKQAEIYAPDFYNGAYFKAMATWQKELFKSYQGHTIDDTGAYWSIMIKSHELNKK